MNDIKMNIAGTLRIAHDEVNTCYATVTNSGEIVITGTEEEIVRAIQQTPDHLKYAGHLILEIMRLRRALNSANAE